MRKKLDQYEYNANSLIGDGGFAFVYRARDKHENRDVAVKILKSEFEANTFIIESFFRDPQIVRKLNHEFIVQILDVGNMLEKPYFFAMEYCEGGDLKKRLQQRRRLTIPTVLDHTIKLCGALEYIHSAELYHRDIKASNILYRNDDTPLFTDFGIAVDDVELRDVLNGNHNIGSPPYMSPEVWTSKGYDATSDLYSFGILMYYALTGVFPFCGKSPEEYKKQHVHSKPTKPSQWRPGIPKDLDSVILALLEKDKRNRISSAGQLEEQLRNILANIDIISQQNEKKNIVIFLESNQQAGITINEFPYAIGKRAESENGIHNNLVIKNDDASISRFHAYIDRIDDGFVFTDTSTNGSIINGTRVRGKSIMLGDDNKILLGHKTKMIIRTISGEPEDLESTKSEISILNAPGRAFSKPILILLIILFAAIFLAMVIGRFQSKSVPQSPHHSSAVATSSISEPPSARRIMTEISKPDLLSGMATSRSPYHQIRSIRWVVESDGLDSLRGATTIPIVAKAIHSNIIR